VSVSVAIELFIEHIMVLMEILTGAREEIEDKLLPSSLEPEESTIVSRLGALNLVQAMYDCLSPTIIRTRLNLIFSPNGKGNELTTEVMKAAHAIKSENRTYVVLPPSLILEYHCTAYNTLASVVMCTQQKEEFFTVFCFKVNSGKGELLWENIVDLGVEVNFEAETNFPMAKKEVLFLYNKVATGDKPGYPGRYISSHYLADSSLSQDMIGSSFFGNQSHNKRADALLTAGETDRIVTKMFLHLKPLGVQRDRRKDQVALTFIINYVIKYVLIVTEIVLTQHSPSNRIYRVRSYKFEPLHDNLDQSSGGDS